MHARAHVRAREGTAGDAAAPAGDGRVLPLGTGASAVPEGALAVARRLLAAGTLPARFLWPAVGGAGWHPVRVSACREAELPGHAPVVVAGAPGPARGRTPRELEVLTLLARG